MLVVEVSFVMFLLVVIVFFFSEATKSRKRISEVQKGSKKLKKRIIFTLRTSNTMNLLPHTLKYEIVFSNTATKKR